jgi:ribosomal protein S18 acetylase RimI-like enzyme
MIDRFRENMEHAHEASAILDLAGISIEDFCQIEAVGEKQRNFANDLKIAALASIWRQGIKEEYRNQRFARALVRAILDHQDARFWCDQSVSWQNGVSALALLKSDFKRHLAEEAE